MLTMEQGQNSKNFRSDLDHCLDPGVFIDTVEPLLSNPLGRVTIRLDNGKPKMTGLNGVGTVDWRLYN